MSNARAAADRLARLQRGAVHRRQLLEAGVGSSSVTAMLRSGHLLPSPYPGAYVHRAAEATREQRIILAVLAAGPGAVAGFETAGELLDLGDVRDPGRIHVVVPRRCRRDLPGVRLHAAALPDVDRRTTRGVPTTAVPRTVRDLAAGRGAEAVEDLVIEVLRRRLADISDLARCAAATPNAAGTAVLREVLRALDLEEVQRLMSRLESLMYGLVRRHRLPPPEVNRRIDLDGPVPVARVDLSWPWARLIVEVDGLRWHSTRSQKRNDDARQNQLIVSGWRVLRYDASAIRSRPADVAAEIARALAARGRSAPPTATDAT